MNQDTGAAQKDFAEMLARISAAIRESSQQEDLAASADVLLRELVAAVDTDGGVVLLPEEVTGTESLCALVCEDPRLEESEIEAAALRYLAANTCTSDSATTQQKQPDEATSPAEIHCVPFGHALWAPAECRHGPRGVVGLFRLSGPDFTQVERGMASLVADQVATAVNYGWSRKAIEAERKELDRASFSLFALRHATRMLGSLVELDQIIPLSMDMLVELTQAESGHMVLHEKASPRFAALREARGLPSALAAHLRFIEMDPVSVRWFVEHREPVTKAQLRATGNQAIERAATALLADHMPQAEVWAPLVTEQVLMGYVALAKKRNGELFVPDEIQLLATLSGQVAGAIQNSEKSHARELFRRYVSAEVVEEILRRPIGFSMAGKRQRLTILFADIRSFTSYAEHHDPAAVLAHLNEYFPQMGEIVFEFGGTLAAYIGDGLMVLFGAPLSHSDDAGRAVSAARKMQRQMKLLREKWRAEGKHAFEIGIGIHTGEAIVGDIGFEKRMEYTAVGDAVNVAARLEGMTKNYPANIIVSKDTLEDAGAAQSAKLLGTVAIRGKTEPVVIYGVEP